MIKTEYICDKCGHTQPKPEQMWFMGITVSQNNYGKPEPRWSALWCRDCVENAHLLLPMTRPNVDLPPPPTFEDLIRDIMREEIEALKEQ